MSTLSICVAGVTGWTGGAVAEAVAAAEDLELHAGVSRSAAGGELHGAPVYASVEEALDGVDVLIDYTSHDAVKANTLTAIERGVAVVIGTSGLTADDFAEIDEAARARGVGVISAGNFSVTAAMAQAAALLAAKHIPSWEVIDYASAGKADAPSGTARELAELLGAAQVERPVERDVGRARGARRHDRRHAGALAAAAELHGLDRGGLRPAGRAAVDPPRRRIVRRAVRGRHAAGRARRAYHRRGSSRPGHAASAGLTVRSRGFERSSSELPTLIPG